MAAASMGGDDGSGFGGFRASEGRGGGSLLGLLGLAAEGRLRSRPRGRPYSRTAYEAAPRIRQGGAPLRVALSPAAAYGVFGGATAAAFLLFLAGFLAAFWLVAPDGAPVAERAPAPAVAAPEAGAAAGGLIPRATAGDAPETRAPPAPEIAAAERAMAPRVETPQLAALPTAVAPATEAPAAPMTEAPAAPATEAPAARTAPVTVPSAPRARLKPVLGDAAGGGVAREPMPVEDMSASPPEPPAAASSGFTAPGTSSEASDVGAGAAYELQFGAFRERANADALLAGAPESLGARLVESRDAAGRPLYFIRAGGFETAAEARAASARIEREAGLKSFVRRDAGAS
ncbi:MAG: SPOR domain-containing protein [Alphaproteobacteria bacterium]|nr:SPOR domain-containing protein [Alphaproteobacteria bacterium]